MFTKILIPLDGSNLSERALLPGLRIARNLGAQIVLMRVAMPALVALPSTPSDIRTVTGDSLTNESTEHIQTYLNNIEHRYETSGLNFSHFVGQGNIAEAILQTAQQQKVDLIVMSTHGYSGVTRWLLGSVTEKVLRHAPCPVLTVRGVEPIKRIMIALDGSPRAEAACRPALELARLSKATVYLMHAVEPQVEPEYRLLEETEPALWQRMHEWSTEEGRRYLDDISAAYKKEFPEIETILAYEPAAEGILNAARAYEADLIVLTTHGRSGIGRFVYGSVTEKVLRHGERNLLVIRNKD